MGGGTLTGDFFKFKNPLPPPPHYHHPKGDDLFTLNVKTAPVSALYYHKPLCGMSESCQNPQGCPWEAPGDSH